MDFKLVKMLSELPGVSGDENKVRDFIISRISGQCEYRVDPLGNIIASKKGSIGGRKSKVAFFAHMDEVGFIVTDVTDSGYLKFGTVGGIEPLVLGGKQVEFKNGINGVIGLKPVHLTDKSEKNAVPEPGSLVIDIGAESRKEALEKVRPGDTAVFRSKTVLLGNGYLAGKALDDRLGCAVLMDMIAGSVLYDTYFVFTVNEETGTFGARAAAQSLRPDIGVIIETTTASDTDGTPETDKVTCLGKGPVISYMDRGTLYDSRLYETALNVCNEENIKWQTKSRVAGGNDSRAVQGSAEGAAVIAVSMAARNLHSPNNVVCISDYDNTLKLAAGLNSRLL